MKFIASSLFTAWCLLANGASADSVKPFLVMLGSQPQIVKQDIRSLATYELLILDRFRFKEVNNNTWKAIKTVAPDIDIYLYQAGPVVANNHDLYATYYLNNLGRFDVSRTAHGASINKDHPEWFLKNAAGERITGERSTVFRLDFGNEWFTRYWVKHTLKDVSFQDWRADGVYMDVANVCRDVVDKNITSTPVKYSTCASWNKKMNGYLATVSPAIQGQNQLFAANRGHSRYASGFDAWKALDQVESPPDFLLEEGAFALPWGDGDVQFLSLEEWKRQIDLPAAIKQSAIGMLSHTDLAPNETGKAIDGEPVSYEQILRFAAGSYLLARNITGPDTYFMFAGSRKRDNYNKLISTDIYSQFEIGVPMNKYKKVPEKNIYFRQYSEGYVYVNPTSKEITNIKLASDFHPQPSGKNIKMNDDSWVLRLKPHESAILKAQVLPAPPKFKLQ